MLSEQALDESGAAARGADGSSGAGWRLIARGDLPVILLAALAQGWALYGLHHAVNGPHWPATNAGLTLALYAVAVFVPLTIQMLAGWASRRQTWVIVACVALAFAYFGWRHGANLTQSAPEFIDNGGFVPFGIVLGVLWLMVLPFAQCRLIEGSWRPRYAALFDAAWRNKITLAEAVAFTGLFWMLLALWQQLFRMLGIGFFHELFEEPIFVYPVTALVFGAALHLIGSVERLTRIVLEQVLNVLKWLALLAGLILVLFTIALVFRLPGMIASGERVIGAAWLLWLVAVTVLLINAAYRDGSVEAPYPRWVGFALRCAIPLTIVIALTAVYALYLRIDAHGLTTERVWACIVAAAACAYAIGYGLAARRSSPWMAGVARVNVATAWFLIGVIALTLTPVLSPHRLAANSQFAMALENPETAPQIDSFRTGPLQYLRFDAGAYGLKKLRELAALEDHPRAAELRKAAEVMLAREHRWEPSLPDVRSRLAKIAIHPQDAALDEALRARLEADLRGEYRYIAMHAAQELAGVFIDLDADQTDEFVFLTPLNALAYRRAESDWRRIGVMHASRGRTSEELATALTNGDVHAQPPRWRDLVIGAQTFRMEPGGGAP